MISQHIPLRKIVLSPAAQPRAQIMDALVESYREDMRPEVGATFPPVVLFHDAASDLYYCADGFHRVKAAQGIEEMGVIGARVFAGDLRDAVLWSVGANSDHGLRRTNEDKRRVVKTLLEDEEWQTWSDSLIAEKCKCSQPFVSKMRLEWEAEHGRKIQERRYVKGDGTEGKMDVSKTRAERRSAPRTKPRGSSPWPEKFEPVMGAERARAEALEERVSRLWGSFQSLLKEYEADDSMKLAAKAGSKIDIHFSNLLMDIRNHLLPVGPCSACDSEGCQRCAGGGWVTEAMAAENGGKRWQ